ncbi:hypothetical protein COP2_012996 [Malus domestica]
MRCQSSNLGDNGVNSKYFVVRRTIDGLYDHHGITLDHNMLEVFFVEASFIPVNTASASTSSTETLFKKLDSPQISSPLEFQITTPTPASMWKSSKPHQR